MENVTQIVEQLGSIELPAALGHEEIQAMIIWEQDQAAKRAAYAAKRGPVDRKHYAKTSGVACALPRRPADLADAEAVSTVKRIKNNPKYKNR